MQNKPNYQLSLENETNIIVTHANCNKTFLDPEWQCSQRLTSDECIVTLIGHQLVTLMATHRKQSICVLVIWTRGQRRNDEGAKDMLVTRGTEFLQSDCLKRVQRYVGYERLSGYKAKSILVIYVILGYKSTLVSISTQIKYVHYIRGEKQRVINEEIQAIGGTHQRQLDFSHIIHQ